MMLTVLVPQGAEYGAVCRGLKRVTGEQPTVKSIPVGVQAVGEYLQQWSQTKDFENQVKAGILVVGLCGSLTQQYKVGDVVLYQNCLYQQQTLECSHIVNLHMQSIVNVVKSWTSDRVICSATEKRYLGETMGVDVVDMEGFAVLDFFHHIGVEVAMLRVVSDDCNYDIPDISTAINSDGSLKPLSLAWKFIRQPIAANRLIRGSLQGLKVLEQTTELLFSEK
ncbi:phosphorylase family protein [Nostoc sp. CMAA1605]|uniref:phosphorylase family protein n=1 Tax=Nostoc sp. CMAA1605 TaxID=2055159 RepID=UPI001F3BDE98|nr:phosphorylase [Nostoc sp. CMAA1605]MCF4967755.1 phosphorylase [Nostoc sp. CMAA1605]